MKDNDHLHLIEIDGKTHACVLLFEMYLYPKLKIYTFSFGFIHVKFPPYSSLSLSLDLEMGSLPSFVMSSFTKIQRFHLLINITRFKSTTLYLTNDNCTHRFEYLERIWP